jgi:hypothetical protein
MPTRFMYKALATAALGIALSLVLAAPTTASPASSQPTEELQLDPPAAPSNCRIRTTRFPDPEWPRGYYVITYATWTDNSSNEDGFTLEVWIRQSGRWVLGSSESVAANSTAVLLNHSGPGYRFRVKAFNASGDSAWSNWAR